MKNRKTVIFQRKAIEKVFGVQVYSCVQQNGGVLAHGYQVGNSEKFIVRWQSVVNAAKRQAGK